jgi:lipoprotein-anchoring transpeptidase ErfK/SrfK
MVGFSLLALLGVIGVGVYLMQDSKTHIAAEVSIAGVNVGGKSEAEAQTLLTQNLPHQIITLVDGERTWQMALGDLGVQIDLPGTLALARQAEAGTSLQPKYWIDLNQSQTGFINLSTVTNFPPKGGQTPQEGRMLDIPVMLDRFRTDLTGEIADDRLELSMISVAPPPEDSPNLSPDQTSVHVVQIGQELGLIAREYGVTVEDIVALNGLADPNLINPGDELLIPAAGEYVPTPPPAPTQTGKSILVDTSEQRIYAYENGQLVHSHLTSTGLPATPTVIGDFKVYVKYRATDMRGEDYYLPDVPFTMYFYQGYGIHGAYWHNSFGRPMSHGCVNLPIEEAEWFFNWAEVGTPVKVI